ncbi:sugar phosphate nucleotidyltransferase [Paenibacillus humicola]|uniref:sugar phosphate nucleotidyltransferase n=1 Tax=Paenibacillus humicola TaxID=3110540 RepID=UPI00237B719D|nr:sugar phosphate nucleotidyltransferase [Paenibacillus humicola]
MKLLKGLILCAGKGTRLYPFTRSRPKTLMPVANTPLLHFSIMKFVELGIRQVGIVVHPSQEADIRGLFGDGGAMGVELTYIDQHEPRGIADALKQARAYIAEEPFLLLLGDNLISASLKDLKDDIELGGVQASLLLAEVEIPQDYGIAVIRDSCIVGLEEKPAMPKSNLAVMGAYAFTPAIFDAVDEIRPSKRGEYEITDAIQWLIQERRVVSYRVTDQLNIDVGTMERWLQANQKLLEAKGSKNNIHESVILERCTILEPVTIARDCVLKDCRIGPYVSVGAGSKLENVQIENSILLNGVHASHLPFPVKQVIFGEHAIVAGVLASEEVKKA